MFKVLGFAKDVVVNDLIMEFFISRMKVEFMNEDAEASSLHS